MLDKLPQVWYNIYVNKTRKVTQMEVTYLVETWYGNPYNEVLEDDFDNEKEAVEYAEKVSHLLGVTKTKVFKLENEELTKIAEFE